MTRFYWVSAGFLRLWSDGAGPIFVTWASFIVVVFVVFCFGFSRFSSGPLRPYGIRSATTERQLVTVSPNGSRPSRRWSHEYIVSFSFRFLCLHFGFISLRFGAPSSSSSSFFLSFCLSFFLSPSLRLLVGRLSTIVHDDRLPLNKCARRPNCDPLVATTKKNKNAKRNRAPIRTLRIRDGRRIPL